jgi:hypothetical protein
MGGVYWKMGKMGREIQIQDPGFEISELAYFRKSG